MGKIHFRSDGMPPNSWWCRSFSTVLFVAKGINRNIWAGVREATLFAVVLKRTTRTHPVFFSPPFQDTPM